MKDLHLRNLMVLYKNARAIILADDTINLSPDGIQRAAVMSAVSAYRETLATPEHADVRTNGLVACKAFLECYGEAEKSA